MPALADKSVDRASSLAPDVALEGPTDAGVASPTEDEELAGNAASVDAMMEATPDEPEDGGGILAAMMASEEEAAEPAEEAATDPLAGMDLPAVGTGLIQGEDEDDCWVVDDHATKVTTGATVLFEGRLWTVTAIEIMDFDAQEFSIGLEADGETGEILDDDPFAVVEASEGSVEAGHYDDLAMGSAAPVLAEPDRVGRAATPDEAGDMAIKSKSLFEVKTRKVTDDLYKERGIMDVAGATGMERRMRKWVPKKMRAKMWTDAAKEFNALEGAEVSKQAPKYRKMMVRAVERLDDYSVQIETARAMAEPVYAEVSEAWEAARAAGDDEEEAKQAKSLGAIKQLKDKIDKGGPEVQFNADKTHERSQKAVAWSDRVALQSKSDAASRLAAGSGDDVAAEAPAHRAWVDEALNDRIEGKKVANDAHGLTRGILDEAVFGTREKGYLARKAKRGKKAAKSGAGLIATKAVAAPLSYLSGGMVETETRQVDGGDTKRGINFNTWKSKFQRVKAECAQIEENALYGEHTGLYNALKMMTDFGLPTLQGVLKALVVWGILLAPVSMGIGLGVSAVAGTIGIVVTALKGVLEIVLALWSAKRVEDFTDRDARKKKLAKAERWKHGRGAVQDAATLASLTVASTSSSGKQLSPDEAASKRFTDVTNTEKRGLGQVSTAGAGRTLGVGKVGAPSVGGLDTSTVSSKSAGSAAGAGVDGFGRMTGKSGHRADEERKRRFDPVAAHGHMKGLSEEDAFFSASVGPAPEGPAPLAPGEAPRGPAPAPPEAEQAEPEKAAAEGSKARRLSTKIASGLASAAGKVTGLPEEAKEKDPEADQNAADLAQIASDAAEVAEALP